MTVAENSERSLRDALDFDLKLARDKVINRPAIWHVCSPVFVIERNSEIAVGRTDYVRTREVKWDSTSDNKSFRPERAQGSRGDAARGDHRRLRIGCGAGGPRSRPGRRAAPRSGLPGEQMHERGLGEPGHRPRRRQIGVEAASLLEAD